MPYKNPEHKMQWEAHHRPQRLARRRELRRIATARKVVHPEPPRVEEGGVGFLWLPIVAGAALASYSPTLAIGAGGLTLVTAAALKKTWDWWIVGLLVLPLGVFFQWNNPNTNRT